ncbi:hypothetical protein J0S82_005801, partial [Galemys pyrenaicus]
ASSQNKKSLRFPESPSAILPITTRGPQKLLWSFPTFHGHTRCPASPMFTALSLPGAHLSLLQEQKTGASLPETLSPRSGKTFKVVIFQFSHNWDPLDLGMPHQSQEDIDSVNVQSPSCGELSAHALQNLSHSSKSPELESVLAKDTPLEKYEIKVHKGAAMTPIYLLLREGN